MKISKPALIIFTTALLSSTSLFAGGLKRPHFKLRDIAIVANPLVVLPTLAASEAAQHEQRAAERARNLEEERSRRMQLEAEKKSIMEKYESMIAEQEKRAKEKLKSQMKQQSLTDDQKRILANKLEDVDDLFNDFVNQLSSGNLTEVQISQLFNNYCDQMRELCRR